MPFYESQPVIYPLYRLLEEVLQGVTRVPLFQRPGTETTWKPEQRGDLLDSVFRGYPIGTILLWATSEPVGTMAVVGGAVIPTRRGDERLRLVLDGHQRISTLVAILGPAFGPLYRRNEEGPGLPGERWVFDVSGGEASRTRDRFILLKEGMQPGRKELPMEVAFDRVKLNEWVRERASDLTAEEVRAADALRDRIREYAVPVAALVAEKLEEATESFKRINSAGTPMDDFHMVAALSYGLQFDPQRRFAEARQELLEPIGWEAVEDLDLLRVCSGILRRRGEKSQHPAKLNIEGLARSLKGDENIIVEAVKAVEASATVFASAGVYGPAILPYSWQIIVLAIELGSRGVPSLSRDEQDRALRWFWLTTYGGVFAGVNSAVIDRASGALTTMLAGGGEEEMVRDISPVVEEPHRFDFRAVRARACVLAMARFMDDGRPGGRAHRELARGNDAVHPLVSKIGRSVWYNLVIATPDRLKEFRAELRGRAGQQLGLLDRPSPDLAIPGDVTGSLDDLLQARRLLLLEREKVFIRDLGLEVREDRAPPSGDDLAPVTPRET